MRTALIASAALVLAVCAGCSSALADTPAAPLELSPPAAAPPEATATAAPPAPNWLLFSGADVWHSGGFAHAGLLWSPGGLYQEGFTLKLLGGAGTYRYRVGGPAGIEVAGTQFLGSVMPGWRFKYDRFELVAYAGLDVQDHRLTPDDPGNALRGTRFGVRVGADVWYEIVPSTMMLAANASVSSLGVSYWTRVAAGWRLFDMLWLGPEGQALGGPTYQQWRAGLHGTSFKTGPFEWSAGGGFTRDSDHRNGFYARLGVLVRH